MHADEMQQKAIDVKDGPCLVLAGPGSGKTTVLVNRIHIMITKYGIPAESLMVITFTRASALEMRDRFYKLMMDSGSVERPPVTFGTFHSIFYAILRNRSSFKDFTLLTGKNKNLFIRECAASLSLLSDANPETFDLLEGDISAAGNASLKRIRSGLTGQEFERLYSLYGKRKRDYHMLDFDDMLSLAKEAFETDPDLIASLRKRFRYFLVDEAQDMNALQYDCMKLLSAESSNLFLVGDDDQSIYGFRGASAGFLLNFGRDYPDCQVIRLSNNYRCAGRIVAASGTLIMNNKERFEKTPLSKTGRPGEITMSLHAGEKEECSFILNYIRDFDFKDGRTLAVLSRHRADAAFLMETLDAAGIPYYGGTKKKGNALPVFWDDVCAWLSLASGGSRRADVLRVMNLPDRRIPRYGLDDENVDFQKWIAAFDGDPAAKQRVQAFVNLIYALRRMALGTCLLYIKKACGYEQVLSDLKQQSPEKGSLAEAEFAHLFEEAKAFRRPDQLLSYMQGKKEKALDVTEKDETGENHVFLYTYHGSKGLEFSEVILLSVNETIVPSKKAVTTEEVEEERRAFYVAMTRAKEKLVFSCIKKRGKDALSPSRFLYEMKGFSEKTAQA